MQDKKLDDMTKKYKEEMMRLYSKNRTNRPRQSQQPQQQQYPKPAKPAADSPSAEMQPPPTPMVIQPKQEEHSRQTVHNEQPPRGNRGIRSFDVSPRTIFKEVNTEEVTRDLSNPPMPEIPRDNTVKKAEAAPPVKPLPKTPQAKQAQQKQQKQQTESVRKTEAAETAPKSKFPPAEEILKRETEGETVTALAANADRKPPSVTPPAVTRFAPEEDHYQGNYDFSPLPEASEDNNASETDMQGEIQPDINYPNESSDFSSVDTEDVFPEDNPRDMSGQGYLQVEVTAAQRAIPVQDAAVIVTESAGEMEALIGMAVTDENGSTPVMPLPAPSKSFSESPDPSERPYSEYNIRVYKKGFYTVPQLTVPIFDGIKSIQPVSMIPLAEFERDGTEEPSR